MFEKSIAISFIFFIFINYSYSQNTPYKINNSIEEINSLSNLNIESVNWLNVSFDSTEIQIKYNGHFENRVFYLLIVNNKRYFLGRKTRYLDAGSKFCKTDTCKGINNTLDEFVNGKFVKYNRFKYVNTDKEYWANFIMPMQKCESERSNGAYSSTITNDGTSITIGYFQLAAHVRNGAFVSFLKILLEKHAKMMNLLYPDLKLTEDKTHIYTTKNNRMEILDNSPGNKELMEYFNPDKNSIDYIELINFSKFSFLFNNNAEIQNEFDEFNFSLVKKYINQIGNLELEYFFRDRNLLDYNCLVICDLFHNQGEDANKVKIKNILSDKLNNDEILEKLIMLSKKGRRDILRSNIKLLINEKKLGTMKYDFKKRMLVSVVS